ncbi:M18 family aminopeptidase [Intrasporangium calvum]|uniref:M18 family aminopeptidase n=1 Tax=Intrasporangium calvum (strain ATCC 23552 / DSM 43043 / JCM 3097 / NBRC 12989 / NCIMB 10167 / NRRL B-3866 / 7 KIP) TaxID=710696 RepID=E6S9M1_INTC7|nr:M18 family aminopeptidase [Intrasporangium calvum]ADU49259.1 Aspartyl aminopeptidase [Intrasporangium calvum DSM 43043]
MAHPFDAETEAQGLIDFVDASPTPFHACGQAAARLSEAGFTEVSESEAFPTEPGAHFLVRGGSLIAWDTRGADAAGLGPAAGFRVVGAHTDSPNLRVKPNPDHLKAGWQSLGVEVYGGPLLNSWLDRDLGLAGRVTVRGEGRGGVETRLFHDTSALLRVAQLAIHLDREQNDGLTLNRQLHLEPLWGLGDAPGDFRGYLSEQVGVPAGDILGWDVMTHPVEPSRRLGRRRELVAAPRLDNLATSYAGVRALLQAAVDEPALVPVLVLFDHEEIGSTSERGAMSTLLPSVLERLVLSAGGSREDYWRALASTVIASGDMAHATHPNYADRHEPLHQIAVNGGPVLKVNANLRYATDSLGEAAFRLACEQAGVPMQSFVIRTDLPCGSTIGPMTSALTGATTVDFGAPLLSMHSARELCGAEDPAMYAAALSAFLAPLR